MQDIMTRVEECMNALNKAYNTNIGMPDVQMNSRLRTTAGRANKVMVEFATVLYKNNHLAYMNDTIPHEVCHYFVDNYFAREVQAHGVEWKAAMRTLGIEPKRCHSMEVQRKRWLYECACGKNFKISTVTHNRITKGAKAYRCTACDSTIVFQGRQA